jgi:two-component system nitrate/nitrite sensor histidine kinase NarX
MREGLRELVMRIDHLVVLIEQSLESKLQLLRVVQGTALVILLLVGGITVYQLRDKVLLPLRELLSSARKVRRGDFSVRLVPRDADELGQLGEAFNFMVRDLSQIYSNLETRVREKTNELERSNRSLELLYGTTRALSESAATRETLRQVLAEVERVTGMRAGAILLCPQQGDDPIVLAADMDENMLDRVLDLACPTHDLSETRHESFSLPGLDEPMRLVTVPLSDGTLNLGVMALALRSEAELADWQLQLIEAVGRHVGTAIAAARRDEERHRIALLDERSVIARELHDSLAQSLSFLNIQVARLQKMLPRETPSDPVQVVVGELKEGLHEAYRQLRELLTTFRLRIDGRGLNVAIEDAVQEFSRRGGLTIALANRLPAGDLASSQEIHVLQVIREALSNIERHAHARDVAIELERRRNGRVFVAIEDDGTGIEPIAPRHDHYGITIMRDRAQSLNGELTVVPRAGGGTRVELEFPSVANVHQTSTNRLGGRG